MSREQRQRQELLSALVDGDLARAAILAREHLWEFPDDADVRRAVLRAASAAGTAPARREELRRAVPPSEGELDGERLLE